MSKKTDQNRNQKHDFDSIVKVVELKQAAKIKRPYNIPLFLERLADPVPAVSDTAMKLLMELLPMASLPWRWHEEMPEEFIKVKNVPGWLYSLCEGWGKKGDFIDLCIQKLLSLHEDEVDGFINKLALLHGCHNDLPERLNKIGQSTFASLYLKKSVHVHNSQFPKQLCFSPTLSCNLNCEYCISAGILMNKNNTMPFESATRLLDWTKDHSVKRICLSGGEPTLYPNFSELLHYIHKLGMEMLLATNGLGSYETTESIIENQIDSVTLHLSSEIFESGYIPKFTKTASRLLNAGIAVALRFNLYKYDQDPIPYIDVAKDIGFSDLRIAVPIPNANRHNRFVDIKNISKFGEIIAFCVAEASKLKMSVSIAKPFPLCMVPENVARIFLSNGSMISNCQVGMQGFSHNLLVNPDLTFSPCLGLNRQSNSCILHHDGVLDAANTYRSSVEALMRKPFIDECLHCPLSINGRCIGACPSYRLETDDSFFKQNYMK